MTGLIAGSIAQRALSPDQSVHARHGAESGRFFPGPRSGQSVLLACPTIVQNTMDKFAERDRRQIACLNTSALPMPNG